VTETDEHASAQKENAKSADPISEILAAWAAALSATYLAWRFLGEQAAPFASAFAWAAIPLAMHVFRRRPLAEMGLALQRPGRTGLFVLLYGVIFLPLHAAGYFLFHGLTGWRFPGIDVLIVPILGHFFFAGLPEEIFFRGYVQPLLAARLEGPARRILGVPLSRAIAGAAALFALTHLAFEPQPFSLVGAGRLLTFFPGLLFGALREETGDIVAPALFHALANASLGFLQAGYAP